MSTFPERMAAAREAKGLNQSELARLLGVTPQAVQSWEAGKATPRGFRMTEIARLLEVDYFELTGMEPPEFLKTAARFAELARKNPGPFSKYQLDETGFNPVEDEASARPVARETDGEHAPIMGLPGADKFRAKQPQAEITGSVEEWSDDTPLDEDTVALPFLKEVELAAGSGRTAVERSSNKQLRFGKYSLKKEGVQAEHAVAVTVRGNSMEPVLPDGATVAVNTIDKIVTDGKTYAINHAGQLRVKLLYRLPGGGLRIRSYNRDEHPDEEYSPAQVQEQEIAVIGRVFWGAMFF